MYRNWYDDELPYTMDNLSNWVFQTMLLLYVNHVDDLMLVMCDFIFDTTQVSVDSVPHVAGLHAWSK